VGGRRRAISRCAKAEASRDISLAKPGEAATLHAAVRPMTAKRYTSFQLLGRKSLFRIYSFAEIAKRCTSAIFGRARSSLIVPLPAKLVSRATIQKSRQQPAFSPFSGQAKESIHKHGADIDIHCPSRVRGPNVLHWRKSSKTNPNFF
jgi:hypothetical protein